jgi:CheY-like chemotaxis protein
MAYGFVKQSGGHLSVYSEPDLGTTFRLYLPRNGAGNTASASASKRGAIVGGDETVLLVEDNEQLRRATARQLTELGYRVREGENADAALMILSSGKRIDLLFSDVVMPGTMNGLDLAQQATLLRRDLKVLLTSGFPGVRGPDQSMARCPFLLLNKPYRRAELARAVREALDGDDDRPQPLPCGQLSGAVTLLTAS